MKVVNEAPILTLASPKGTNQAFWAVFLRNMFGIASSHAMAINDLYENIEDDVEYVLKGRTYNGLPIYFKRFTGFAGGVGSVGTPLTVTIPHNITGLLRGSDKWKIMSGVVMNGFGVNEFATNATDPTTGHVDMLWESAVSVAWRMNYDSTFYVMKAYMEYQRS
jgi:hypothetical protein